MWLDGRRAPGFAKSDSEALPKILILTLPPAAWGFFYARPVRVFSRLEHTVRKEIKLPLMTAAIKIATTVIVQLIKHFLS